MVLRAIAPRKDKKGALLLGGSRGRPGGMSMMTKKLKVTSVLSVGLSLCLCLFGASLPVKGYIPGPTVGVVNGHPLTSKELSIETP